MRPLRILFAIVTLLVLATVGGFGWFLLQIPRDVAEPPPNADAAVVLTGGAERVSEAIDLLAAHQVRRLLISGVHPETTEEELAKLHPKIAPFLACCIELDRRALNTAGNAVEAGAWVRRNGFQKVVIVTSNWHMPRTLVELGRALPNVTLVPYAVFPTRMKRPRWWEDEEMARLLATEYVKYLAALAEFRVAPRVDGEAPLPMTPAEP